MPVASGAHLPPPKSWDEFEEICADLFSREWADPQATRYGRQGQRQNGVDIYGTPCSGSGIAGVQCKGRRAWPPPPLSVKDIDVEVDKAKNFDPAIVSLTIATTAPDDVKLQDHVRLVTGQHAREGLFSVHAVGWGEISRRLTQHSDLLEKHYGFVALASLRQEIQDVPAKTAELVAASLKTRHAVPQPAPVEEEAYDAFISHASEDKDVFVRPLAAELVKRGLSIWYDEFSLMVGDSLSESIDTGLSQSRYGIVILSHAFFRKGWTKRELGGLISRETNEGKRLILPVWLGLSKGDVVAASPTLADIVAIDGGKSIEDICDQLLRKIRPVPVAGAARRAEDAETGLQEASERDLAQRYKIILRRHLFGETTGKDEISALGAELLDGRYANVSPALRRQILLRATRSAAAHEKPSDAARFLAAAASLAGEEPDAMARARIADAEGHTDDAIRMLRDRTDPESRAVLLSILERRKGFDAALDWWRAQGISTSLLTYSGVHVLALVYIKQQEFEAARDVLDGATQEQLENGPCLLFLRAASRLACLFAKPERGELFAGLPVVLTRFRPILTGDALAAELDRATNDLTRLQPVVADLELPSAQRTVQHYLLWCDLLHPARSALTIDALIYSMKAERPPIDKLSLAFTYIPDFDPEPVTRFLERHEKFGGLDEDELFALFVIHLHGQNARQAVEFVSRYRARLGNYIQPAGLLSLEIQALAKAGDALAARHLFDARRAELDPAMVAPIEAEVAHAEGVDPVAAYQTAHAQADTVETLRTLIGAFESRGDHRSAAEHALKLYRRSNHPDDMTFAAIEMGRAGDIDGFVALVDTHPFILQGSHGACVRYGWALLRRGRIKDARDVVDRLIRQGTDKRELNLEIAIAIESGDWEAVAQPLEVYRTQHEKFSAIDLLRAASLARATGQSAYKELLRRAVEKGGEDPNILINAYLMTLEDNSDESGEPQRWFQKALELSGPDGPLQAVDLKELLGKQREWNEHSERISRHIVRGEIPLAFAAEGLRTTSIDIVLRNLVRNDRVFDARKRVALPLFSGRRRVAATGEGQRAAFDASALLVLGWLDLLPAAFDLFAEIVLPAGAVPELFEGVNRIQQVQRSRLVAAARVNDAIIHKGLQSLPTVVPFKDLLAQQVGDELASLIHAAARMEGIVLRPAPVHRLGLDSEADADMSPYASILTSMHELLKVLSEENVVDGVTETAASQYFALQDKGWAAAAKPDPTRPLLIDGLALTYLQTAGLLDAVLRTFPKVFVDAGVEDEAMDLLEHGHQVEAVAGVVDRIRIAVRDAHVAGKVTLSSRRSGRDDMDEVLGSSSTLNLVSDLRQADIVVFDDRALNADGFAADKLGHRARTVTSLDLIEELHARGTVSPEARRRHRNKLRRGGATLIPVDAEEIEYAAFRSGKSISPEFRAIRDSIDLARVKGIPRFPAEVPWFASLCTETKTAIFLVWKNRPERAAEMSNFILALRPVPGDWIESWEGTAPPDWAGAVHRMLNFGLSLPIDLEEKESLSAYNDWLERIVLQPIRELNPSHIDGLVTLLRQLIATLAKDVSDGA